MKCIEKSNVVPEDSIILNDFGKIDYCDSYRIEKQTDDNVDAIITQLFKPRKWVDCLMKIRNSAVKLFGLKTGDNRDQKESSYYAIGSRAICFTVIDRNDNEIVVEEDDKHLNFRTSVLIDRKKQSSQIFLTTVVQYNNMWGRIYFVPVKPFHKLIIKSFLKRYLYDK
ncbi:MAG: DUF2867 domain-containing protein [Bacteroidales bacterium]|nr:DUF2867 domain-containing protein [Bacteroidales bacterium]